MSRMPTPPHGWFKKLLGEHFNLWILALVFLILTGGVVASLMRKNDGSDHEDGAADGEEAGAGGVPQSPAMR